MEKIPKNMKIIPSINAKTLKEAQEKINLLKNLTQEFHFDIASFDFCGYQTWNNPIDLEKLDENSFEIVRFYDVISV